MPGGLEDIGGEAAALAARAMQFTAPALFARAARLYADRTAVVSCDVSLSYRELDERTTRLADSLASDGLRRGDSVAVLSTTRPEYIEVYLAAAKLSVTVVGLNIRQGPDDLEHCLELTRPRALFASAGLVRAAKEAAAGAPSIERVIAFPERGGDAGSEYEQRLAAASPEPISSPAEPEDIHCVLFTSGTTGRPKGVMVSQRASAVRAFRCADWFGLGPDDGMVGWIPMFHTGGDECVKATFLKGGTFATFERPDPEEMFAAIERHRLTWTVLLPGVITDFLDHPARLRHDVSTLRFALGYANMMPRVVQDFCTAVDATFWDTYGQTETSFVVALDPVRPGHEPSLRKTPAPFLELRLVDGDMRDVPDGTPGECVVRGPSVMSGYVRDAAATAEVFRGGWLHTGDLLVREEDGRLTFVDRLKYLIKTGGENVYPAEIETVLAEHPAVREACAISVPDKRWGETVKAVVVLEPGRTATPGDIRDWCRERLPGYKTPRYVQFLRPEHVPRSGTGKILRHELAALDVAEDQRVG